MTSHTLRTTLQDPLGLFYNRSERRLRAGWRVGLHFILNFFLLGLLNTIPMLLVGAWISVTAGLPPYAILEGPKTVPILQEGYRQFPAYLIIRRTLSLALIPLLYAIFARLLDRRRLRDYGLRLSPAWWRDLGFGFVLGGVLMALIFGLQAAFGWVKVTGNLAPLNADTPFWIGLIASLLHYGFVGLSEELFSRGYQLKNLSEGFNLPALGSRKAIALAVLISSSFFGVLHAGNPNVTVPSLVNLVLWGVFAGLSVVLTGELGIAIGLHISWNFFQGNIFDFPVSGVNDSLSLLVVEKSGTALWTGGAFGPEGGLLVTLAILLGMALTYLYVRWTHGRARLHASLAEYSS